MSHTRTRVVFAVFAMLLLTAPMAMAQPTVTEENDPADQYVVTDMGGGRVRVDRVGQEGGVEMNLVVQAAPTSIGVQIADPTTGQGAYFRYLERDRKIEFGVGLSQFSVFVNDDATVKVGETVCDGRTNPRCVANAIATSLGETPVEGIAAMRAAVRNALIANPDMPLGKEILETFRMLLREMIRRNDLKQTIVN